MRLVANCDHSWILLSDSTRLVFVFGYTVNHRFFFVFLVMKLTRPVDRTNDVDLIKFPRLVARVDVYDVVSVVNAENGVATVPMDEMALFDSLDEATINKQDERLVLASHHVKAITTSAAGKMRLLSAAKMLAHQHTMATDLGVVCYVAADEDVWHEVRLDGSEQKLPTVADQNRRQ